MTESGVVPYLLQDREGFLKQALERLGNHPSDFPSTARAIQAAAGTSAPRKAAGVLVSLRFADLPGGRPGERGFFFQLIKRSSLVPQPGDLSCPGGMIHPLLDRILRPFFLYGPLPILRSQARTRLRQRGRAAERIITLFLATALREAWEEIRLPPWSASFVGPLPTYTLSLFQRTIFPLVCVVEPRAPLRPNSEVERIIEIPLASFYHEEQIGCYRLSASHPSVEERRHGYGHDHPCLFHREPDGREEVLWGATFQILTCFLSLVLGYRLPAWQKGRLFERNLHADYLTGSPAR